MVKGLLIRGANRDALDNQGKKPIDHIPESMCPVTGRELRENLSNTSYCECLMLKVPLVPLKRNHKT
jgi:hypothetical protein